MAKISVIVPVHNSASSLQKCVDSITSQELRDIEVLLVDDGSKDKSGEICDRLSAQDNRIRVFHTVNLGPASARNTGIDNATGEYLAFCDDDDFMDPGALSFMYDSIGRHDILCCGLIFDYEGKKQRPVFPECKVLTAEALQQLKARNLLDTMCNKLYRAAFIRDNGIRLPNGELYEDTEFNLRLLLSGADMVFSRKCFYHYVQKRGSSITRRFNQDKLVLMKQRANGLRRLEEKLGGDGSVSGMFYLRALLSCFVDCFLPQSGLKASDIRQIIRKEIASDQWKEAKNRAVPCGAADRIMIITSKQGVGFIGLFCRCSYVFKYKTRRLFFKLR